MAREALIEARNAGLATAEVFNNIAYTYLQERDLKHAEETLEQAIRLNPNDATIYYNKGNALSDLKRYEEAVVAYEQAIRFNPGHARAYFSKAVALEQLERSKEAQQAYGKARLLGYST